MSAKPKRTKPAAAKLSKQDVEHAKKAVKDITEKVSKALKLTDEQRAELSRLVRQTYHFNLKKNEANTKMEKARKELYKGMKSFGLNQLVVEGNAKFPELNAHITCPVYETVDVKLLYDKVEEDTFLEIVTATKKAVTDLVGGVICAECSVETKGNENVTVKAAV